MYHVVIAQDMRTDPERQAQVVTTDVTQIHSIGASIASIDNPNLMYVADEEGNVLKGDPAVLNMKYLGWA